MDRAIQSLEALLAEDDQNAWAHAHLGDVLCISRGQHEAAVAHLSRAIELDESYAWAFAHRGAAFERLDRFDEAAADFRRALELRPSNTWARAMLCRVHQLSGRFDAALADLDVVIAQDRTIMPDWRAEVALLHTLAGRYERAHGLYLEALAHDAADQLALYNVAINVWLWQGLGAATSWIERARAHLLAQPLGSRVRYELGGLLALEGETDGALDQLALAIDAERGQQLLSPCSKRARIDLAWSRVRGHPRFGALTRALV